MNRICYVYGGIAVILFRRLAKQSVRAIGEGLKRTGRKLVAAGEDQAPRWSLELFHQCYLSDGEFHFGMRTVRGPIYAAYGTGDTIHFRFNWLASRRAPGRAWEFTHGAGKLSLAIRKSSVPQLLHTGDVWFSFEGGYGILYVGEPKQRLPFEGPAYTLRTFKYF